MSEALALAGAGDLAAAARRDGRISQEWYVARVELLYELAYLRIFIGWESFLEQTFVRYLCGYRSTGGVTFSPTGAGAFYTKIQDAETSVLGGRQFVLWHDPISVMRRAQRFLINCPHESVIASHATRLTDYGSVRHRIVHGQEDARLKFNNATMNLAGRRYRGARPGRFLRDWDRSTTPPQRWLSVLGADLANLAQQIV
jgi:hypothetical protein